MLTLSLTTFSNKCIEFDMVADAIALDLTNESFGAQSYTERSINIDSILPRIHAAHNNNHNKLTVTSVC